VVAPAAVVVLAAPRPASFPQAVARVAPAVPAGHRLASFLLTCGLVRVQAVPAHHRADSFLPVPAAATVPAAEWVALAVSVESAGLVA
jgi:hypothetical protein